MRISSSKIRGDFIKFFLNRKHDFVPSSSVIPKDDLSLAFTNAGMNQFKNIFLGFSPVKHPSAVNSQKCIRVGGKHNDLSDVGKDGTHHTFFEMLGNWSFNNYFKLEACTMAWELLTEIYGLPADSLFVTYFGGDSQLGLPPDDECKEIWLSLGVLESHILPFGSKDNFWEMGASGPCGPCTEIHFDRTRTGASHLVNKDSQDVIEIWNLVFMEFSRLPDGRLEKLNGRFVDTGMGLERLVAVMNDVRSNYDTDLFTPIMAEIQKVSGCPQYKGLFGISDISGLDTGYRILSDHSRMIAVALADGGFPDENHRLRHVIRRALKTSAKTFRKDVKLIDALLNPVVETLGEAYPEIPRSLDRVRTLLRYEAELLKKLEAESANHLKKLRGKEYLDELELEDLKGASKLVEEITKLKAKGIAALPPTLAYQLNSDRGLSLNAIRLIAEKENMKFIEEEFHHAADEVKETSKTNTALNRLKRDVERRISDFLVKKNVTRTDTSCQYSYSKDHGEYHFPAIAAKIVALLVDGQSVEEVLEGQTCQILVNKTNFYVEAGGQTFDMGTLDCPSGNADVISVSDFNGYVLHHCLVRKGIINENSEVMLSIDKERRLKIMANHTATHLLNCVLHECLGVTYQKSSWVGPDDFQFGFGAYANNVDIQLLEKVESIVNNFIEAGLPVQRRIISKEDALEMKSLRTLPGTEYPDTVSVIEVDGGRSVELCCGTHVSNTKDIKKFLITDLKSIGSGAKSIRATTGQLAEIAESAANTFEAQLRNLAGRVFDRSQPLDAALMDNLECKQILAEFRDGLSKTKVSLVARRKLEKELERLLREVKGRPQVLLNSHISSLAEKAACDSEDNGDPFTVHIIETPEVFSQFKTLDVSVERVLKVFVKRNQAVAVVFESADDILVQTFIPDSKSRCLTSENWLHSALKDLQFKLSGNRAHLPKGQKGGSTQELVLRLRDVAEGKISKDSGTTSVHSAELLAILKAFRGREELSPRLAKDVGKVVSDASQAEDITTLNSLKDVLEMCQKNGSESNKIEELLRKVKKALAQIELDKMLAADVKNQLNECWCVRVVSPPDHLSESGAKPQLRKLALIVPEKPVFLLSVLDGSLVGLCRIPESCNIEASDWMEFVAQSLPEGSRPAIRCKKEANKTKESQMALPISADLEIVIRRAEQQAVEFARSRFSRV